MQCIYTAYGRNAVSKVYSVVRCKCHAHDLCDVNAVCTIYMKCDKSLSMSQVKENWEKPKLITLLVEFVGNQVKEAWEKTKLDAARERIARLEEASVSGYEQPSS